MCEGTNPEKPLMDKAEIEKIIPHRRTMSLLHEVLAMTETEIVAVAIFNPGSPFLDGHFDDDEMAPGTGLLEAMAQAGAVKFLSRPENEDKKALNLGFNCVRFGDFVRPGDRIIIKVKEMKPQGKISRGLAKAYVGDTLVGSAILLSRPIRKRRQRDSATSPALT